MLKIFFLKKRLVFLTIKKSALMNLNTVLFPEKKYYLLRILCLLTIAFNIFQIFISFSSLVAIEVAEYMIFFPADLGKYLGDIIKVVTFGGKIYLILILILSVLTIIAAIRLWNLKKIGFYLYIITQTALLIIPFIFLASQIFPVDYLFVLMIPNFIITPVFFILYSLFLKRMS